MTYGEVRATTVCPVLILDSRFWGNTYLGGKFDAFLDVFCILGVFLGGGGIWNSGGGISQEIAGNNTAVCHCMVKFY